MTFTSHPPTAVSGTPAAGVPDYSARSSTLNAVMHTGINAVITVDAYLQTQMDTPRHVAIDIEAAGLGAKSFTIRCVTAAFDVAGTTHAVLLDPRNEQHAQTVRALTDAADMLLLHNAAYDVPPLVWYGMLSYESIERLFDTVVVARMAYPDTLVGKSLESLATRYELLGMFDNDADMKTAFSANGISTTAAGWQTMDINVPVYRMGAMADTVVTLRLGAAIFQRAVDWITSNPTNTEPLTDDHAMMLINREQITNRVMLARSAHGIKVDKAYLQRYRDAHEQRRAAAAQVITDAGLDVDAGNLGKLVVTYLDDRGELPAEWPRTASGQLQADKHAMKLLEDHPLVQAQQTVAELSKISHYLDKVADYAAVTGRVHPQVGVLGASATGRMSYREPELQQFPHDARGILVPDQPGETTGWVSIDWSSIEPVIIANCAQDHEFLQGFNDHGADLYAPIVERAGVDRKTAKVVLLAAMYGQGIPLLSKNLGVDESEARAIQQRVFAAMPKTIKKLDSLMAQARSHGAIYTADGRLLPIPTGKDGRLQEHKARNYFVQGSAYSVLSETLNKIHAAGLADHVQLAMHDELVVDAVAADQIRAIMETPPDWLVDAAGGRVVLRTDMNPLPDRWEYV